MDFEIKCSVLKTLYIDEKQSMNAISDSYDVSTYMVRGRLEECAIPVRSRSENMFIHAACKDIDLKAMDYMYRHLKMTISQVATTLGVDYKTVLLHLNKTRTISEASKFRSSRSENKPIRSIDGHWMVKIPEHPRSDSQGYVKEAYLLWEKWYSELFPENHKIHYINDDHDDLSKENIRAMTNSEHSKFRVYARRREGLGSGGKCPPDKMAGYMEEWDTLQAREEIERQIRVFDVDDTE